jgi:peptidoglycan/LPS O-acetylase OafA/YrhL
MVVLNEVERHRYSGLGRAVALRPDAAGPFLTDIHRIRGVAILLIVATHCMYPFEWERHARIEELLCDLFADSTLVFVFIAGYLFKHGSANFAYGRYLSSKLRNVILPFLLVSVIPILRMLTHGSVATADDPTLQALSLPAQVLRLIVYPGLHFDYALWFVPVVTVYYLAAPLLLWLSRRVWLHGALLCVLVPLSTLMHRPTFSHDHNLALALYFLSAYLLGMWACRFRAPLQRLIEAWLPALALMFVATVILHLLLSTHHGKYSFNEAMDFGDQGRIDWSYVQKLLLLPVLLGVAWRSRHLRLRWLDRLADMSFTIFFLHLYVIALFQMIEHRHRPAVDPVSYLLLIAMAVLIPCAVAWSSRRAFPTWSRSLVGS